MNPSLQAVLAAVASLFLCRNTSKRQRLRSQSRPWVRRRGTRPKTVPNDNSELSSIAVDESATFESESVTFDPTLNRVSMAELAQVTGNFSQELIIGCGSFGLVYRAKLSSGVVVALKKLAADAFQGYREFRAEMEILGKIRHPNIVKILGYCVAGSERVLIYEYIEKGSLDEWLYDTSRSSEDTDDVEVSDVRSPLSWAARIKIIKGTARGLSFMHNLETPIIHRNIKSSNVLLDANFEAHITDFELARRIEGSSSHVTTDVAGTIGYMPPEYGSGTVVTVKGDVYSFGVLMLEIITGRRLDFLFMGENGKKILLTEWVNTMAEQKRYMEMIDGNILKNELKEDEVIEAFRIAKMCANENVKIRPAMKEVVQLLDGIST